MNLSRFTILILLTLLISLLTQASPSHPKKKKKHSKARHSQVKKHGQKAKANEESGTRSIENQILASHAASQQESIFQEDKLNSSSQMTQAKRSTEWKNLPPQNWEKIKITIPAGVDPLGFDKNNKIPIIRSKGFESQFIPSSEKLDPFGQIVGSRSEGSFLGSQDTIYIRPIEHVQVGVTYSILSEPTFLKSQKSDRIGYSYRVLGKVKILGVRDSLFVGKIMSCSDVVSRGNLIYSPSKRIPDLTPIPGTEAIQGILMLDHSNASFTVAQHKEVFIDRGSVDGVKPGMIFRAYEYYDPSNNKRLTHSNYIIDADLIITQVSPEFSTAIVLQSRSPVIEGSTLTLLTDISDLYLNQEYLTQYTELETKDELEELDRLDSKDDIGKMEQKELKQLEKWKGNPVRLIPSNDTHTPPPKSGNLEAPSLPNKDETPLNIPPPALGSDQPILSPSPTPEEPSKTKDSNSQPPTALPSSAPPSAPSTEAPAPPIENPTQPAESSSSQTLSEPAPIPPTSSDETKTSPAPSSSDRPSE